MITTKHRHSYAQGQCREAPWQAARSTWDCMDALVTMHQATMGTGKRMTYKNLLLKAQPGLQPTSTLLTVFSLSGHLVLSQDSSF